MSGEKKGGSRLVKDGQTLAQIGAAVCNAVVDAGGTDENAKSILNNPTIRKAIGDLIMKPRWEVTSNAKQTLEFIQSVRGHSAYDLRLLSEFSPLYPETFTPRKLTDRIKYRLRGVILKDQKDMEQLWREAPSTQSGLLLESPPLEVAILLRMQIKPEELGFPCAVMVSPFVVGDAVFYPVLLNSGILCCWSKVDVLDFSRLLRGIVFIFCEA